MIIYPGQRLQPEGVQPQQFQEAIYMVTPSGWQDADSFKAFVEKFTDFVKEKGIQKPVILFLNGYKSHLTYEAVITARERGVVLYLLHGNSTHIIQPWDMGIFSQMKGAWSEAVARWSR